MLSICIIIIIYMDAIVHRSHSTEKKELHSPGFELATSGLPMKSLRTTLTHHATKSFVKFMV